MAIPLARPGALGGVLASDGTQVLSPIERGSFRPRYSPPTNGLADELRAWIQSSPPAEESSRRIAGIKIEDAHRMGALVLNLAELDLSSLPHLVELGTIRRLDISKNALRVMRRLPPNLEELVATSSQIDRLPDLPTSLLTLKVANNWLTELPPLPSGLKTMDLSNNRLRRMPVPPASLRALNVSNNSLVSLAETASVGEHVFLANLRAVFIANNNLRQLPRWVLQSLSSNTDGSSILNMSNNRWTLGTLEAVERLSSVVTVICEDRDAAQVYARQNATAAPTRPMDEGRMSSAQEPEDIRKIFIKSASSTLADARSTEGGWDELIRDDNAGVFADFLSRLFTTAEFNHPGLRSELTKKIQELMTTVVDFPDFRQLCFTMATEATESCGDRIALTLNHMKLAELDHLAKVGHYTDHELRAIGRGFFRLSEINKISEAKYASQKQVYIARGLSEDAVDAIEIFLHFQTALAERLTLPVVGKTMLYAGVSGVTETDLQDSVSRIAELESRGADVHFLSSWQPWQEAMKRRFSTQHISLLEHRDHLRGSLMIHPPGTSIPQYMALGKRQEQYERDELTRFTFECTWKLMQQEQTASS